jgi:predicted esterase
MSTEESIGAVFAEHRIQVPRSALYYTAGGEGPLDSIWVVLHGYSMLASRFLRWFAPAAAPARLVVAPEALNRYYVEHKSRKTGTTWMTSHDRGAEIGDYVRFLDEVLTEVRATRGAGDVPVQIHGFSQGAATASRWAAFGAVRPERLVLWGGGVPPDLDLSVHGAALAAASLTLVVGDRDEFVTEEMIAGQVDRLRAAGVTPGLIRFSGGHVVPWNVLSRLIGDAPP